MVFLTSVFTHMFPPDVEHYLDEISRVLKPGGRCLCTYFLLNDESLAHIAEGKSAHNFQHEGPGYRTIHKKRPEEAIGLPETFVRMSMASSASPCTNHCTTAHGVAGNHT